MTAFAAVLSLRGAPLDRGAWVKLSAPLTAITGRQSEWTLSGGCGLIQSPLHASDPPRPVVNARGDIVAAGQVVLEGRAALNAQCGLPSDAAALVTVVAAYECWGQRFTERLSGEFAFVLWDGATRRLLCARDGLGVRMLFVAEAAGALIVTNTIEAALAHPAISRELDTASLVSFLRAGDAGDAMATAYADVRVLPAGHTLEVQGETPSLRRHWWMPTPVTRRADRADIIEGYRDVLESAVHDRLEEGRAGLFLSGGIDSTTIAAAGVRRSGTNSLQAYTVDYRRFGGSDEVAYATQAAHALGLPLIVIDGDAHPPLERGPSTAQPLDEPTLGDWREALASASTHSTVTLYGEDGDALFQPSGAGELLRSQSAWSTVHAVVGYGWAHRQLPYLGIRLQERLGLRPRRSRLAAPPWLSHRAADELEQRVPVSLLGLSATPLPPHPTRSVAHARLIRDVDGFAPALSAETTRQRIEIRLPLLDTRVIEYVFSVPAIPWCQNKTLARAAYADALPGCIVQRRKTPVVGFNEWLVQLWRTANPAPLSCPVSVSDWVDVARWHETLASGTTNEAMAAWRVLMLDQWLAGAAASEALCTA